MARINSKGPINTYSSSTYFFLREVQQNLNFPHEGVKIVLQGACGKKVEVILTHNEAMEIVQEVSG